MAQAGRRWRLTLFPWLEAQGFKQSSTDTCIFSKARGDDKLVVGCYVDDLFVLYSSDAAGSLYDEFSVALVDRWRVEEEGEVSDLLNVDITVEGNDVVLRQSSYIKQLLATHAPAGVPSTLQANHAPAQPDLPALVEQAVSQRDVGTKNNAPIRRYQSLVGALLYCSTNTRPDVAYAVGMLCRAMGCPTEPLMQAAERVLFYLGRHVDVGLRYRQSPPAQSNRLVGFSDSDWATRHSTPGYVFNFNRAAISWASKKQASVSLSSCKAEIVAALEATKEAVYLRSLFGELGAAQSEPTQLHVDNKAAIDLPYNPEHHSRTKHIDRRPFFVRENVENLQITVPFVRSVDNLADFFAKPLPPRLFFPMRDVVMDNSVGYNTKTCTHASHAARQRHRDATRRRLGRPPARVFAQVLYCPQLCTPYTMDSPSPIAPTFAFPLAQAAAAAATGPATRSTPAGSTPSAAPTAAATVSSVRALTTDEKDHFVISPEQLASVDRQLMETMLSTIASPATRLAYRIQCQNSGRERIRLLVTEAKASSPSAGLAIESMMDSLLLKGLSEASLTEFNALHHAFTCLNRPLPAHAQLGNALIAEKLCAVVRRLSESTNTILDVKL
eukprot:6212081-Pleurochrysis_carterae.AAC.5